MSACYKCGRELPGVEIECEPGECDLPLTEAELEAEREANDESKWVEIDWDKVTTFEQLKLIVRLSGAGTMIHVDDPDLDEVKHLLKEKKP